MSTNEHDVLKKLNEVVKLTNRKLVVVCWSKIFVWILKQKPSILVGSRHTWSFCARFLRKSWQRIFFLSLDRRRATPAYILRRSHIPTFGWCIHVQSFSFSDAQKCLCNRKFILFLCYRKCAFFTHTICLVQFIFSLPKNKTMHT